MAVSTRSLQYVYNVIAAQGIPDLRNQGSGYGDDLALDLATRVMADLISERFNWKFNRAVATPFLTNSWQQDYPQPTQPAGEIAWGEDCDICDINNTTYPKPLNWDGPITWMRQLSRTSVPRWRPCRIAWMYNRDLTWGTWPGPNVVFYPLLTTGVPGENPLMNMIDANGNYLLLTGFGTTGTTAPSAPTGATEGDTVSDGTAVWTVVYGDSQGFRIDFMPNATGPVYQIIPSYQLVPPVFTSYDQLLTPIPDSFARHFQEGLEWLCKMKSADPRVKQEGREGYPLWLKALENMIKQGDRETNTYGLIPQTAPVESRWGWKGPYTADQPI